MTREDVQKMSRPEVVECLAIHGVVVNPDSDIDLASMRDKLEAVMFVNL